jgi:ammonia channel protein AmtB
MNVVSKLVIGIIALGIGAWLVELYGRPDSDGILPVVFGHGLGGCFGILVVAPH